MKVRTLQIYPKRRRRFVLPAHSKLFSQTSSGKMQEKILQTRLRNVSVRHDDILLAGQTHCDSEQSLNPIGIDTHSILLVFDLYHSRQAAQRGAETTIRCTMLLQLDRGAVMSYH